MKSGVGLAPLPAPLADLDDELMYLIGPMQEPNYPVYLFAVRFECCVSKLGPITIGADTRRGYKSLRT